jgi:hypothetical protein
MTRTVAARCDLVHRAQAQTWELTSLLCVDSCAAGRCDVTQAPVFRAGRYRNVTARPAVTASWLSFMGFWRPARRLK